MNLSPRLQNRPQLQQITTITVQNNNQSFVSATNRSQSKKKRKIIKLKVGTINKIHNKLLKSNERNIDKLSQNSNSNIQLPQITNRSNRSNNSSLQNQESRLQINKIMDEILKNRLGTSSLPQRFQSPMRTRDNSLQNIFQQRSSSSLEKDHDNSQQLSSRKKRQIQILEQIKEKPRKKQKMNQVNQSGSQQSLMTDCFKDVSKNLYKVPFQNPLIKETKFLLAKNEMLFTPREQIREEIIRANKICTLERIGDHLNSDRKHKNNIQEKEMIIFNTARGVEKHPQRNKRSSHFIKRLKDKKVEISPGRIEGGYESQRGSMQQQYRVEDKWKQSLIFLEKFEKIDQGNFEQLINIFIDDIQYKRDNGRRSRLERFL